VTIQPTRRAVLAGAGAVAAILALRMPPAAAAPVATVMPAAAPAIPHLMATYWYDGPVAQVYVEGHVAPDVLRQVARDAFARRDTDAPGSVWGPFDNLCRDPASDIDEPGTVARAIETEEVVHEWRRITAHVFVDDPDAPDGEREVVVVALERDPHGYPIAPPDCPLDDDALAERWSIVRCGPDDVGAFPVTIMRTGLEA
jgi:hypothetical protein